MPWEVEYTNEFGEWWHGLTISQQDAVVASVDLLMAYGPNLSYPYSSDVRGSRHGHMRELRVQSWQTHPDLLCLRSQTNIHSPDRR